jgi:polyhydroxyalkanoate synthesis regulator phasin
MELSQEYFDQVIKSLATKGDVLNIQDDIASINQRIDTLPTHSDLTQFATKQDLERFATKDDLLELATRTEMRSLKADVAEIKEIVQRNFKTAEEDIIAVIKDVEIIKNRVTKLEHKAA